MKYLFIFCFSLFSLVSMGQRVNWSDNYLDALEEAKTENKLILVYFFDGGKASIEKTIKNSIFKSNEFKSLSNQIIVLKVDKSTSARLSDKQKIYNKRMMTIHNKNAVLPALQLMNSSVQKRGELLTNFSSKDIKNYLSFLTTIEN